MFLTSNNPTPCFGDTVDLICHYPDVMEMVNGHPRYAAATASYRGNGLLLFPDENVFDQILINQTANRLRVRIDPANFTGDPVSFTCLLPLTVGGVDSSNTRVVDPQGSKISALFDNIIHLTCNQSAMTYIHQCNLTDVVVPCTCAKCNYCDHNVLISLFNLFRHHLHSHVLYAMVSCMHAMYHIGIFLLRISSV